MSLDHSKAGVFISVGHGLTIRQRTFVAHVESLLRLYDFVPIIFGREEQMAPNPIGVVRSIIEQTVGTIVIAFARLEIVSGIEYPESKHRQSIASRRISTVWNQMEAAMTFQAYHPLLILAHEQLHEEGIIDPAIYPTVLFSSTSEAFPGLDGAVENGVRQWIKNIIPLSV